MSEQQPSISEKSAPAKKENLFLNIGFNILLPIFILNKGKSWFGGGLERYFEDVAVGVLLIAIAFPVSYFTYDYFKRAKYNIFSILGLISVLMSGGIGILHIPTEWFAVKEAGIPLLLGLAVIISLKTPYPLIRKLLYNPEIMNVERVQTALKEREAEQDFEKLLKSCTWLLAGSFFLSAGLNYLLARRIVTSQSGTDAFNVEVSKMMVWSWPIVVAPSLVIMMVALYKLVSGIKRMTGLNLEQALHAAEEKKADNA